VWATPTTCKSCISSLCQGATLIDKTMLLTCLVKCSFGPGAAPCRGWCSTSSSRFVSAVRQASTGSDCSSQVHCTAWLSHVPWMCSRCRPAQEHPSGHSATQPRQLCVAHETLLVTLAAAGCHHKQHTTSRVAGALCELFTIRKVQVHA
jgi:hypothetical protein